MKRKERRSAFRSSLVIEPPWRRWALALVAAAVHAGGFVPLYQQGGVGVSALSFFPVVIVAWLFGAWGGLVGGLASMPLNAFLLDLVGEPGWEILAGPEGIEASALVVVVGCVIGLLRDLALRLDRHLTEWRRAERTLREAEDRYRVLFERSRDALYVSRPDGTVVDANGRFLDLFGYSRSEIWSLSTDELYEDPEDRTRFKEIVDREGFVEDFPVRLRTREGAVLDCLVTATARHDADRKVVEYHGSVRDVSASRSLHALADRKTRELQDAVSELEAFTYSVSHDLRTHLVTMGGFATILWNEHRHLLDEEGQEYLDRIVAAGRRMDAFVQDLLSFSRVRSSEVTLERVDLVELAEEAVRSLEGAIQERGAHVRIAETMPMVLADRVLLSRVLENLISNAVKFVPSELHPEVEVMADDEGSRVRLYVRDNGIGIPADQLGRVFRAFERVDPGDFPGTGVGLTIVQKAVQRMGGDVGVRSTPGEGSTFWVVLRAAGPPDLDEE